LFALSRRAGSVPGEDSMTTPESPVESIISAALAKGTPEERAAYLDEAYLGDPELRRRVERLLEAQPKPGSLLQGNAPDVDATLDEPPAPLAGELLGQG